MDSKVFEAKTIISEDVEIIGTVKSSSAIRICGRLNGDLNCSADADIGETANIKGNVSVSSVIVNGQISGNVMAKDKIELKAAARVNGDIKAKRLMVEDGVSLVGKTEVNPSGSQASRAQAVKEADDKLDAVAEESAEEENKQDRGGIPFLGKK